VNNKLARSLGGIFALMLSGGLVAQDEEYVNIRTDLANGLELQEVSDRAYENAEDYWEFSHAHLRDGHEHQEHDWGIHDGTDEVLSAGEAVAEIYANAGNNGPNVDPDALDIIKITIAVVNSWPDCEDTFDAVRSAVTLLPNRVDEIVAEVAVKRNCNCNNGGMWVDQRLWDRLRVEIRHQFLEIPLQCSCSQVAMYAGISGLPENFEFTNDLPEAKKLQLIERMTEKVVAITDRTAALQSRNGWQCGCTGVNIAATMQGIEQDELRNGTYDRLAEKYAKEAADTGMVVDSFGIVGLYPMDHWGDNEYSSHENTLRRQPQIFRGDNLILDPFHPATEFLAFGKRAFENLGQHEHSSGNTPTDLFISEYVEGWSIEALASPAGQREDTQRNRVIELYNGSDDIIDLGNSNYFLEIYGGPPIVTKTVKSPPVLMRKTISLLGDATFDFDKSDIRAQVSEDMKAVVKVLNSVDIFSEVLIVGHTCDIGTDEYNIGLSNRRADSVRDYLREIGLKDVALRTEGHGEREPRVPNNSIANRSRNRRVELTFITRDDAEIETSVTESQGDEPKRLDITFLQAQPGGMVSDFESEAFANRMPSGEYITGDMKPREVIGLNGPIDPGATFVVAYDESDEVLTDVADLVTGQLDFLPNETLVLRRLGGNMALNCRAQGYSYVTNYPPIPRILPPILFPPLAPRDDEIASPN